MLNRYFVIASLWTGLITWLCLAGESTIKKIDVMNLSGKDKVVHFSMYFVFTIAWYFFFKNRYGSGIKTRTGVFVLAVVYGALIEIAQYLFTSGRTPDIMDELANSTGSGIAILLIWLAHKMKK